MQQRLCSWLLALPQFPPIRNLGLTLRDCDLRPSSLLRKFMHRTRLSLAEWTIYPDEYGFSGYDLCDLVFSHYTVLHTFTLDPISLFMVRTQYRHDPGRFRRLLLEVVAAPALRNVVVHLKVDDEYSVLHWEPEQPDWAALDDGLVKCPLLEQVSFSDSETHAVLGEVCRALVDLSRRRVFVHLTANRMESLRISHLVNELATILESPLCTISPHVRHLTLQQPLPYRGGLPDGVLRRLPNLTSLTVDGTEDEPCILPDLQPISHGLLPLTVLTLKYANVVSFSIIAHAMVALPRLQSLCLYEISDQDTDGSSDELIPNPPEGTLAHLENLVCIMERDIGARLLRRFLTWVLALPATPPIRALTIRLLGAEPDVLLHVRDLVERIAPTLTEWRIDPDDGDDFLGIESIDLPFAAFTCLRTLAFDPIDWCTLRVGFGGPSRALVDFLSPILAAPNLERLVLRFKIDKLSGKETLRDVVFMMDFRKVLPKLARVKLEDVRPVLEPAARGTSSFWGYSQSCLDSNAHVGEEDIPAYAQEVKAHYQGTHRIQGLNLIHPSPPPSADQDLVSNVPDLSAAQLDFWANFNFTNEDGPLGPTSDRSAKSFSDKSESPVISSASAQQRGQQTFPQLPNQTQQQQPQVDIGSLLYALQQQQIQQQQQQQSFAPQQLASLLALQGFAQQQNQLSQLQLPPLQPTLSRSTPSQAPPAAPVSQPPPPKRQRTVSAAAASPATPSPLNTAGMSSEAAAIAAAEDKRRRNTAASARFRMKKKEREAALEGKAKELEERVAELERECETLRRENDWLKGLVVGVTGSVAPPTAPSQQQHTGGTGTKRGRDD
ncbi:uncharacterized protein SCHCODRAFT_02521032 [Schizophyllum commune H4-8]|uniref:BZIP domain-containing protein n=1 Tax=Schizophyllum commune (strain H4-8 / FGSC 9210) TaxID=578458 RepID=D8QKF1_SCHCM|nr:uncharacterized protein SCHCODRAFT_02521032 [Schizophyllum commune H4-8]KAI5885087.1 hypothetical protein SCHCODRAFT_02521032 [Schizophyllum commune H4-8]